MFVNIVSKYCLFISQSFEYTVYFIVMVYLLRSVVIIIVVVVKHFIFSVFQPTLLNAIGTNDVMTIDKP